MENAAQNFLNGIDVSSYQGTINWSDVANSGVVFAICRASYGITDDTSFSANWSGTKAAKIKRGAYHCNANDSVDLDDLAILAMVRHNHGAWYHGKCRW
jgi:GH25 family lysozyme M1 (1,4-beta-N-acetylmuramidase)